MSIAQQMAKALGGQAISGDSVLCPGPGHSRADRSLKVSFRSDGSFVVHSFVNDDWRVCRDHVAKQLGLDSGKAEREFRYEPDPFERAEPFPDSQRTAFAMRVWEASERPGRMVKTYLASRGIDLPADMLDGHVIRYHGACPFTLDDGSKGHLPAMVCLFRDLVTDEPKAIHRIALEQDGSGKSRRMADPKKMLGPVKGCAVKLCRDEEVTEGLAISEGVENALTAICGGLRPVWAMGSAGAIQAFPVLPGIEALTILADHDKTGIEAARECARRWSGSGREAVIAYPSVAGTDWNDMRAAS